MLPPEVFSGFESCGLWTHPRYGWNASVAPSETFPPSAIDCWTDLRAGIEKCPLDKHSPANAISSDATATSPAMTLLNAMRFFSDNLRRILGVSCEVMLRRSTKRIGGFPSVSLTSIRLMDRMVFIQGNRENRPTSFALCVRICAGHAVRRISGWSAYNDNAPASRAAYSF